VSGIHQQNKKVLTNQSKPKGGPMGLYNLDKIFSPKSIAIIGASKKPKTVGEALLRNLVQGGTNVNLYPVNHKYSEIHGVKTYKSLTDIQQEVDLAVIATPIAIVPEIVEECVKNGVGGAIIISAGGKEIGLKGHDIEQKILKIAYDGGLRIIGPNCLGVILPGKKINASFATDMPRAGNLAFISQSGAICTAILDLAFKEQIGFSHFVSIGSMIDVDFGDMIDYLGNDPQAKSILLYIENLTNFRKFMSAARAVSRVKPIVVLKSGRSAAGAKAAASHTGAMAGEDIVYDAAFQRTGVIRVDTIQDLFDCAELMAKQPRLTGSRLAIITNGGGPGVMATDALARYGVDPATLDDEIMDRLNEVLPAFWSRNNPIDILGDASPERFAKTIEICIESKKFDALMVILAPQALSKPENVAQKIIEIMKHKNFPIFATWIGGRDMARGIEILNNAGVPTYETPERAIHAFLYMYNYSRNLVLLDEIPPRLPRDLLFDRKAAEEKIQKNLEHENQFLEETESKEILSAYGFPVNETKIAREKEEAVSIANKMGYPVVLKILSPDITHKTDAQGVQLNLMDSDHVQKAFDTIMEGAKKYKADARISGVTVQTMIGCPDMELLIGAKKDPNFGPVILFGMGGIYTEILKDRAVGLPPMNRLIIQRLLEQTRVYKILKGYRGRPGVNMDQLEELILRLAQLMVDFPEIKELDMNPVIVKNSELYAIDARILLEKTSVKSPMHLVISPYPDQYEFHVKTTSGVLLFIRPIKPEDAELFVELFNTLSPTSIYYRFFRAMKQLSHKMLARFTQVDYDREISMVAIEGGRGNEKMIGVSQVFIHPDGKHGEFSILVGDPWHGKGVGAKLLEHVLKIAKKRGILTVWGTVLRENINMLALGRKLGFKTTWSRDGMECELNINLKETPFEDIQVDGQF
jgi:acetyltransferase